MNRVINQEIINQIQINYDKIPLAIFLLGTNGCGKSSLRNYLNLSDIQTNIDPDMLNRIFMTKYPHTYPIESAKQALKMYNEALETKLNICLESTLSGHGTMQRIITTKQLGYKTVAYYIGLNSVELNLQRIALRVENGGHNIKEQTVRRRYNESASNLCKIYSYLDELHIIDNSDLYFRLQYSIINQTEKHQYCNTPEPWTQFLFK